MVSSGKRGGLFFTAVLLFTLVLATSLAFGQGIVTGRISGTVQDPQGAVVPNATVRAVQVGTGAEFSSKADQQGYFELKALPIGAYNVTIEASGFSKLALSNVNVESDKTTALGSQQMKVGATTEVVNVEAANPMIETTSSQIGGTFETKVVRSLPNAGAGFDNLALFVPGMANNGSTNFSNTNGAAVANNGLRGRSNNFQIDGQANNDNSVAGPLVFLSNPDILQEVQIVTNNFGAEYGRNSGSVVNYLTKSGSNAFHGSAFEFYEGDWDRSKNNGQKNPIQGFCPKGVAAGTVTPFAGTGCRTPVIPRFDENRFGGTIGGPVVKNHLWFFASYQKDLQKAKSVGTSSGVTPTPAGLAALATAFPSNAAVSALQTFGPYGITAGSPTPIGNISNVAVSNGTTTVTVPFSAVTRTVGNNADDQQITARGDWQISSKDHFFFRYIKQDSNTALGSGTISSGAFVAIPAQDRQYGWDYVHTWTPNLVQQVRVSYGKGFFKFAGGEAFPQCTIENVTACPPSVGFSDSTGTFSSGLVGFGLATNLPQDRQVKNYQYVSNLTWTRGRHTWKMGGELDRQHSPNHFLPSINGGFTFNSVGTTNAFSQFIRNASNCPAGSTCSQVSLTDGPFNFDFAEYDASFYGQDDWRIKDNLTLNLGLRWEWDQQAINFLHDITVKNVASGFWSASAPTSVTEVPHVPEDYNNFGPNIGFAWTPRIMKNIMGDDKTVIRGGYRIAYDPSFFNIYLNVATNAPVVNAGTIFNVGVPATATGAAVQAAYLPLIPRGANPGSRNQTRVTPNFHNPYVEQWSLGVERQITGRISLESRYVGNHGIGNFQSINGDPQICTGFNAAGACTGGLLFQAPQYIPAGVTPCTAAGAAAGAGAAATGRTDCNFTLLRIRNNGAWSIYHGLQNELKIRTFHGLTANVAYTWSKGMDNASEVFSSTGGATNAIGQNPFNPNRGERGVSAQSFKHVVTTYWVYDLPWMSAQNGVLGHLLGGWTISGTHRYQSGLGLTPLQSTGNGDPYCDGTFSTNFGNGSICRPLLSNPNAPFDTSGRYLSATQLINVSTCQSTAQVGTATCPTISPSDVHFIVNNTFAINNLCGGDPFKCTVNRNVTNAEPRNQVDFSLTKNFKIREGIGFQLRADAFNVLNYQFFGTPGLNVNSKNINGVNTAGAAPGTFGEVWNNTGTIRSILVSGHITF